jgi:hypothetical protein
VLPDGGLVLRNPCCKGKVLRSEAAAALDRCLFLWVALSLRRNVKRGGRSHCRSPSVPDPARSLAAPLCNWQDLCRSIRFISQRGSRVCTTGCSLGHRRSAAHTRAHTQSRLTSNSQSVNQSLAVERKVACRHHGSPVLSSAATNIAPACLPRDRRHDCLLVRGPCLADCCCLLSLRLGCPPFVE